MTNIGAIHSRHKNLWYHKKSWMAMNICDALLPNGMHIIITWKTELLLIAHENNIFN